MVFVTPYTIAAQCGSVYGVITFNYECYVIMQICRRV